MTFDARDWVYDYAGHAKFLGLWRIRLWLFWFVLAGNVANHAAHRVCRSQRADRTDQTPTDLLSGSISPETRNLW